ncbi:MAG: NosD domain-containing protein, partial [Halobacteriota archaeon]
MDKRCGILLVSVTILVLSFVGTASATNWSVDGSGGADFTGIQEAINNAKEGDTILVYSGIYYENVVVNKSVTLRGIGHPVVDANDSDSAITLTADGITLVGFNATNSGSFWWRDAGIKVTSNNNRITGNNVSNDWCGISLDDSSNNNTITGNNVNNDWCGISLSSSSNNNITGNNVSNNVWGGISLEDSSNNNTVTGNNVCNNNRGGISLEHSSNNNTITGNVFLNDGLSVHDSYQNIVQDNTVNGKPLVYLEDVSDYKVEDAGQVIIVNCNNITIENLDLSNTDVGIELWRTENST